MLTISYNQWNSMKNATELEFFELLVPQLHDRFPTHLHHMDDTATLHLIKTSANKGKSYGFEATCHTYYFIDLSIRLGASFDKDPQLPWAQEMLTGSSDPWPTMKRLYPRAYYHIEYMMDRCRIDFPTHAYQAMRANWTSVLHETLTLPKLQTLFANIWPRKAEKMDDKILAALNDQEAVLTELCKSEQIVLAFLLGSGFETDPAYPWSSDPDMPAKLIWTHLDSVFVHSTQGDYSNG